MAPPTLIVPAAEPARDYSAFLAAKGQLLGDFGFEPVWLPDWLFPAQRSLVEWAVRKGRAGIYADCGLGKGPIQLVVGENVVRREGRPYLIVAPLAVTAQFVTEAAKFGIEAVRSSDGRFPAGSRIVLTNYERLHHFDPDDFAGASCDESGCIKGFKGRRRKMVTEFLRRLKYRLLCTATPAPNDFVELGTSSEALGDLGLMDMLSRFFRHDQNTNHPNRNWSPDSKWRFRGHSQHDFWQWVCSWARAVRKPSDLGFDDGPFVLPELVEREHVVPCSTPRDGFLFALPANGLKEQREERRLTLEQRCEAAAALVAGTGRPAVSWCHLNPEGRLLAKLIPGAVEVRGSDPEEKKEEAFAAFQRGEIRVLVTKPTIAASGLNWQHCAHQTFFPSNSFEQYYQAVRRSYRFGQANPVTIDIVTSEGEAGVLANLRRKAAQAEVMFARLVALMNDGRRLERPDLHTKPIEVPPWLQAA